MNITKRLDVLEKLLNIDTSLYPHGCDCTIKSRTTLHHMPSCPYRQIREIIDELRAMSSEGDLPK